MHNYAEVKEKGIFVNQPSLPNLEDFNVLLKEIWKSKILTNNGKFHQQLELELAQYLGVEYISLFTNGTLALIAALQVLDIKGEVITTPYSFVATTHAIKWNGITPVFCDIDPITCNIDPKQIEKLLTENTSAILPVHVYGTPCDVEAIQDIGDVYGVKIIYDAAHAFGVKINNESILNFGDLSVLSFHATKVYNTFEGGAIICHDPKIKKRIDYLKNFGFAGETTVIAPGINAKMNELQAAVGILQLKDFEKNRLKRKTIAHFYREELKHVSGIEFLENQPSVVNNYGYFPIFVNSEKYGMTRDELYYKLKENKIFGRRYFYPLISHFPTYRNLESSNPEKLPWAEKASEEVICLPIYADLEERDVERIISGSCVW
ncbi:MAG: DegT/DnrJ/EryC1/StrS family aminotransferase [Ignavibacteriales bacterium]|nr:DegT/DnrJ/EryC1/StrS family aminotransferase [Ignavibacteriales bacterium]